MSKKLKLSIGADPEIFLVDAFNSANLISSIGKIGGSKYDPLPLPIGKGFAVQEDNVALEYNIPASKSADALVKNIGLAMAHLGGMVAEKGLAFSTLSAAYFPEDQLLDPMAKEFGCEPDFNAWTNSINPRPAASDASLRSCGGHVHVGVDHISDKAKAVKLMDLFLGVPSTLMDSGDLRKQLYGKAGAFRPKPYGFEYRVLSNYWIFTPKLTRWIWENTQLALESMSLDVDKEQTQILEAINGNNKQVAQELINKFNIPMVV
jgi:hypothetical protein